MTFGYTSTPTEVAGTRCEGASCRVAARRVVHYVADGVEVAQKALCSGGPGVHGGSGVVSLVDEIQFLGTLVDAREIAPTDAVARVVAASDGGLTAYGAADLLRHHTTVREDYRRVADAALRSLREMGLLP